jgi:DNA-binding response OmpR family regulator
MNRILLVEDNKKLSALIAEYLTQHGFSVACEPRGDKAVYRILNENYFLVIIDINLPGLNGLQICRLVRKNFSGMIIMLTASESDDDHITGLAFGADDFIKKPIQPHVLLARIQAFSKRATAHRTSETILVFDTLLIDLEKRIVKLKNKIIDLKPTEFDLLALLATHAGTSLTRDNIMQALRGIDYDGVDRTIDLRISYLRSKLEDNVNTPFRIKTIRGKGYAFQPDAWK